MMRAGVPSRMDRVMQTRFGGPEYPVEEQGNCFAAAMATILGIGLAEAEGYLDGLDSTEKIEAHWWEYLNKWLKPYGFAALYLPWSPPPYPEFYSDGKPGLVYIANGPGPRGFEHSVVYCDGELLHDPHPSGDGLSEVTSFVLFVPLFDLPVP